MWPRPKAHRARFAVTEYKRNLVWQVLTPCVLLDIYLAGEHAHSTLEGMRPRGAGANLFLESKR